MSSHEIARLQEEFALDGSLKSYIELRRRFPEQEVSVSRFAGLDSLLAMESSLREAGIDLNLVVGALDADKADIEELSLQLIERICRRQKLKMQGDTHIQRREPSLSDSLINYLAATMLETVEWNGALLPPALLILVRQQLGGPQPEFHKRYETSRRKKEAVEIAIHLQEHGIDPSVNKVAEALQVEPSTVSRWFPNGSLLQEVEQTQNRRQYLYQLLGLSPKE